MISSNANDCAGQIHPSVASKKKISNLKFATRDTRALIARALLAIQIERFEHWSIAHGKEYCFVGSRSVQMRMLIPQRHDKRVALFPFEAVIRDLRRTAAAKRVVDHGARVPVRFCTVTGREKLYGASDRLHRGPAVQRIAIFEQITVEGIPSRRILCQCPQRGLGVAPLVMKEIC